MDELQQVPDLNNHSFLSELLLMPNADKTDASRSNMFASNIIQAVIVDNAEIPIIFGNFENQVGEYSSTHRKLEHDYTIIGILNRNKYSKVFFIENNETGEIDYFEISKAKNITESYGYRINNNIPDAKEGDLLPKGTVVYYSNSYDSELNLKYGCNLKSIYLPWEGMTYEDSIVISESTAEKMSHTTVEEVFVTINTNDVLVNLFGTKDNPKFFPDIGERISNKILCARRRLAYESVLIEMTDSVLSTTREGDTIFHSDGEVIDVQIFCNNESYLSKYKYNAQLNKYYLEQQVYEASIMDALSEAIETNSINYSDELSSLYARIKHSQDPDIEWSYNKTGFDVVVIKFTIMKKNPIKPGSKLTNRYGGKGIVGQILKDSEMPMTADGVRAEVILNPLGVINRLNNSQLYEHEINHLSLQIRKSLEEFQTISEKEQLLFNYIKDINKTQYNHMYSSYLKLSDSDKAEFFKEIIKFGIPIHQSPYFDNITLNTFRMVCKKYGIKPHKFNGIEKPLYMGEIYMLKLKHEPSSKFSARSAKHVSLKEIPVKNNSDFKASRSPYSNTPVRLGEQELIGLLALNEPEETFRFLSQLSNNKEDRSKMIRDILTAPNVHDIKRIETTMNDSQTSAILKAYLSALGVEIEQ